MYKIRSKKFNYTIIKSLPFLFNYGTLSYIFITLNFLGNHLLSVNLSLLQSIIFLFTASFSGDFRSLILGNKSYYDNLLIYRIFLIFLFLTASIFIIPFINESYLLIFWMLVLRRFFDWIEEIFLLEANRKVSDITYFIIQLLFLIPFPFILTYFKSWTLIFLVFWIFSTSFIFINEYKIIFNKYLYKGKLNTILFIHRDVNKQIFATIYIALGNYILRYSVIKFISIKSASAIISSFSIGGIVGSLITNIFIPNFLMSFKDYRFNKVILMWLFILQLLIFIPILYFNLGRNFIESLNLDFYTLILSFLGGNIALMANFNRFYLLQIKKITSEREDFIINLFLLILVFILLYQLNHYYESITLILSIFSFVVFSFRRALASDNKSIIFSSTFIYLFALIFFPIFIFFVWLS